MGGSWSSVIIDRLYCRRPYSICVLGLDNVGKTSLVYRLKLNILVETIPTIGFNVETINLKYCVATFFDMGGGEKIKPLWRHYYDVAHGIVYIVDASDKDKGRIQESVDEFDRMIATILKKPQPVLILANKHDLGDCITEEEIIETFSLRSRANITWRVQPASIKEWYGVDDGMDWLSKEIRM